MNMPLNAPARDAKAREAREARERARRESLDAIIEQLVKASALENEAMELTWRAIIGLAGHICGNNDIKAAIEVLDRLPEKTRSRVASKLEIALGWFDHCAVDKDSITITRRQNRLFKISKKSGASVERTEFFAETKAVRNAAYADLCAKRKKLPLGWQNTARIVDPPAADASIELYGKLDTLLKRIDKCQEKWLGGSKATELRDILTRLDRLTNQSPKDTRAATTTAGIGGRPRGNKK